jgi:pimeloyl-ACP methyl ester carboxylesterase
VKLTPRVTAWAAAGEREPVLGDGIHVAGRAGSGPATLVLLHGFPSSSYDFRRLLDAWPDPPALAFDFLGFGLSDKPRDADYSLRRQADLAVELMRRHVPGPAFMVAHDIGASVASELFARDLARELEADVRGALLLNSSMIQHLAEPTSGQNLLRGPLGAVAARLMNERFFRRQFGSIFSPAHPLTEEEAEDQWQLLRHNGGHRLGHRLIGYMDEREREADRWLGALRDWPKPLSFVWGMADPVAIPRVLRGLQELRPHAPTTELDGVGHYPQIEVPERVAEVLRQAVAAT